MSSHPKKDAAERSEQPALSGLATSACSLREDSLSYDDRDRIHKFGECWLNGYSRLNPFHFKKALWLFAWNRPVIFSENKEITDT